MSLAQIKEEEDLKIEFSALSEKMNARHLAIKLELLKNAFSDFSSHFEKAGFVVTSKGEFGALGQGKEYLAVAEHKSVKFSLRADGSPESVGTLHLEFPEHSTIPAKSPVIIKIQMAQDVKTANHPARIAVDTVGKIKGDIAVMKAALDTPPPRYYFSAKKTENLWRDGLPKQASAHTPPPNTEISPYEKFEHLLRELFKQ